MRIIAIAILFVCAVVPANGAGLERPNILFLITDDQRSDTIHALGNATIRTPHIDRLVQQGLAFTNAYIMGGNSMAVCTPSRACLFSGRTLWNLDSQGVWDFAISKQNTTLTEVFLDSGYDTFATGKIDPGFGKNDHYERSFNAGDHLYYRGGHRGQDRTPIFSVSFEQGTLERTRKPTDGKFNADLFADACVEFIEQGTEDRPPFFAYVSFMTPHDPLNAPAEYLEMYGAADMELPANFLPQHPFDAGVHHIRDERLMKRPLDRQRTLRRIAAYYGLMTHTDAAIGRILDALERSGQMRNTIIVFTSDNGLALGSHGLTGKQNVYEHSVKVPLIIKGAGIPEGETRDQLCYLYDIYPTLCELAGLEIPETVEYSSLRPVIDDPRATHRKHLYHAFMQWHRAVRDRRHKLIEFCVDDERHTRLFDLLDDPAETTNLVDREDMSRTLERLRALLESERLRLNDGQSQPEHLRRMSEEFWSNYQAMPGGE